MADHPIERTRSKTGSLESGSTFSRSPQRRQRSEDTDLSSVEEESDNDDTLLPLLEQPGSFEAEAYYWAFPSRPRLLGRTFSGQIPWWPLARTSIDPAFDIAAKFDGTTTYGPVGPHAIHACWQATTLNRVRAALSGLPWTSIDVLRIGRIKLRENERLVIVWVGVSPSAMAKIAAPWALIASKLRAVRAALDTENLTEVECEMRESTVIGAVDTSPRLLQSPRGETQEDILPSELAAIHTVSTAVGRGITPVHRQSSTGTLGLYLVAADDTGEEGNNAGTVWALTCHHVALPELGDLREPPATMMLSLDQIQESKLDKVHPRDENQRERCRQLRRVISSFRTSDTARTLGVVHHAPPIGVNRVEGENTFTRDWALITLDRQKFPVEFNFENFVYTRNDEEIDELDKVEGLINEHMFSFTGEPKPVYKFPSDSFIRLHNIVPRAEYLGQPPAHNLVANVDNDPHLIVLKRGHTTGLTAGIVLDIESMTRYYYSGTLVFESRELTVVHISRERSTLRKKVQFSDGGDSGSIIFDLKGRVVAMLTGGSGDVGRLDLTYSTPFVDLKADIEKTIGRRLRLP
ncbi:MAG: hypothetical protein SEPTF4163_001857 [Sporothrix epigloea]